MGYEQFKRLLKTYFLGTEIAAHCDYMFKLHLSLKETDKTTLIAQLLLHWLILCRQHRLGPVKVFKETTYDCKETFL